MKLAAELQQERCFKNFSRSIKNPNTQKEYTKCLILIMKYFEHTKVEQLFFSGKEREIEENIIDYIYTLNEKQLSTTRIRMYLSTLRHFYKMNDFMLNWDKIEKFVKGLPTKDDRPYSREEMQNMMEFANLRNKGILTMSSSAGLRVGAVCMLKWGDLEPVEDPKIYKVTVYSDDRQARYKTFCTGECRKYIDEYIGFRKRCGEVITKDSILFREEFDPSDAKSINSPKPITINRYQNIIRDLKIRSGIYAQCVGEVHVTHGFRKYFKTHCIRAGVNSLYSKFLMGHDTGLDKDYTKPTDDDLLYGNDKMLGYVSAINELTINDENRLKTENQKLKVERDEIKKMEEIHREELRILQESIEKRFRDITSRIDTGKLD